MPRTFSVTTTTFTSASKCGMRPLNSASPDSERLSIPPATFPRPLTRAGAIEHFTTIVGAVHAAREAMRGAAIAQLQLIAGHSSRAAVPRRRFLTLLSASSAMLPTTCGHSTDESQLIVAEGKSPGDPAWLNSSALNSRPSVSKTDTTRYGCDGGLTSAARSALA